MFDPEENTTSPEMRKLLDQLDNQKKERSRAVSRLKACADEVARDFPEDEAGVQRRATRKLRKLKVVEEAPEPREVELDTREKLRKSRLARKTTLEALKQTTIRTINTHLTRAYSPEELERALNEARAIPGVIPVDDNRSS